LEQDKLAGNIKITLPDSSTIEVEKGQSVYSVIGGISKGLQKAAIAVRVNDMLVGLSFRLDEPSSLRVITFDDPEGKDVYWHSGSHVMAQAVKRFIPGAQLAIGPAIESGFYYDFDIEKNLVPEDLEKIEREMKKISEEDLEIVREELSREKAIELFRSRNEGYKVELLEEMTDEIVSVYGQGDFVDLCRGPHVSRTSSIKAFKLLSIAGAYWRGDEKNKMLQRIYGIAFPDEKQLKKHLALLEEAKKRDHRKLGRELDIFSFDDEVGAGLPLWHPNGAVMRYVIDKFTTSEHIKRGYKLFTIPHIAKSDLYKTSGHLEFYTENMYSPIKIDNQDYIIKPMNCPAHIKIFKNSMKSYRDLPYRGFEMGTVYRYERSGVLHGLTRVRGFTQDDAHIFCTEEQVEDEIGEVLDFTLYILDVFGFTEKSIYLSTRPENSIGTDRNWELATKALKQSLDRNGTPYKIDPGEGVFYGPKIDVKINDAIGREWQCSTIQVDFNLPERFDVSYVGNDGRKHRPIMIHRALMGSLERFIGILIEHYAGKFPLWLSPVQVMLINVGVEQESAVRELRNRMLREEIRAEADFRDETVAYRVRDAIAKKVPFIGVIGDSEVESNSISVRKRGEKQSETLTLDAFIDAIKEKVAQRV
jgi:threonyl-tRNA synthetase